MKRAIIIACLTSVVMAAAALAADDSTNAPPMTHRPMRPMMGNLLPPRILDELALTGDQQTKYDSLNTSFKSDIAQWEAKNGQPGGTVTNAPPGGGRQALRALRKSYIEKLRTDLTADQNAKLTQAIQRGSGGPRREMGQGTNPPTQPPPSPGD